MWHFVTWVSCIWMTPYVQAAFVVREFAIHECLIWTKIWHLQFSIGYLRALNYCLCLRYWLIWLLRGKPGSLYRNLWCKKKSTLSEVICLFLGQFCYYCRGSQKTHFVCPISTNIQRAGSMLPLKRIKMCAVLHSYPWLCYYQNDLITYVTLAMQI